MVGTWTLSKYGGGFLHTTKSKSQIGEYELSATEKVSRFKIWKAQYIPDLTFTRGGEESGRKILYLLFL